MSCKGGYKGISTTMQSATGHSDDCVAPKQVNVMNIYSVDELKQPETYQSDPELQAFARSFAGSIRQIIREEHGYSVEEVDVVLSGVYAERVHKAWEKRRAKLGQQQETVNQDWQQANLVVTELKLPDGVRVELAEKEIYIYIPRDGGIMTPKIKRLGGNWDMSNGRFWLPLSAAKSLPRVLSNWERDFAKKSAEIAEKKRSGKERRDQERADCEKQWAKERDEQRKLWEAEKQEQAEKTTRAKANRTKVVAGKHKIGDVIDLGPEKRQIKSFGQSWTATEMKVPDKYWRGELYEPCPICGMEPVELGAGVCERHHPNAVEVVTEYCYAYFI